MNLLHKLSRFFFPPDELILPAQPVFENAEIMPVEQKKPSISFNFDKGREKLFTKGYTQRQVDSINAIVYECNKQCVLMSEQVAYILATAYHECHDPKHPENRLTPMWEFGGETYLKSKKYYPFYGRGFSQLTWDYNYEKEQKRLGISLVKKPDLMLDILTSANSHVYCMMNGTYTGKKLTAYINPERVDYINSRRVVNGVDKASLIAGYAGDFYRCIENS
jgi:hypothetical protein